MTQPEYEDPWFNAKVVRDSINTFQTGVATFTRYSNAFLIPFLLSTNYFNREESLRFWNRDPIENLLAYMKLAQMNFDLTSRALNGGFEAAHQFFQSEIQNLLPDLVTGGPKAYYQFAKRMDQLIKGVAFTYPAAIDDIEPEFGFHFERQPAESKVDETERFELYQVMPTDPKVEVRKDGKPILIVPPFVLGANILAFLPGQKRSYAHAFANEGIPTYIRIVKKIATTPAVQVMTPEDDAVDTRRFCEALKKRHGKPVTLNGYCQGGFASLCDLLSGELDDLVDAFISCVAPMDGTRSKGLSKFLTDLPPMFNNLSYGTKILPNGNQVADGNLMGWIYKLKSIEVENPLMAMWRDMMLMASVNGNPASISKSAAALNHWLLYERSDLPMEITRVSFTSYNNPITKEGTLPVKLFGRELNLKRLKEKQIKWLICYGLQDDLVEPDTALAPLDFVEAEVTPFPKGHVAIATSWSYPNSPYGLHKRYEKENARGPVRFQLDLQEEMDALDKPPVSQAVKSEPGSEVPKAQAVLDEVKMDTVSEIPKLEEAHQAATVAEVPEVVKEVKKHIVRKEQAPVPEAIVAAGTNTGGKRATTRHAKSSPKTGQSGTRGPKKAARRSTLST